MADKAHEALAIKSLQRTGPLLSQCCVFFCSVSSSLFLVLRTFKLLSFLPEPGNRKRKVRFSGRKCDLLWCPQMGPLLHFADSFDHGRALNGIEITNHKRPGRGSQSPRCNSCHCATASATQLQPWHLLRHETHLCWGGKGTRVADTAALVRESRKDLGMDSGRRYHCSEMRSNCNFAEVPLLEEWREVKLELIRVAKRQQGSCLEVWTFRPTWGGSSQSG